ncbi:MAG: hypothetical protein J0H75_17270, partial [Rhizobiales bacterium]|nr:hypothetical protein [Hyphomicrobiales bacterium]
LDRVADFYSAGCRFESCWDRHPARLPRGTAAAARVVPAWPHNPKNREINRQSKPDQHISPARPHDKPELTDKPKTPGGVLPDEDQPSVEGPTG